jgi:sigma-B regulation protein RsbU (phosphoserine phosphatase)
MKLNIKYPEFLRIDQESRNRLIYLIIAVAVFVVRMIGDVILFYIDNTLENIDYFWNLITSSSFIFLLVLIAFYPFDKFFNIKTIKREDEEFFNDLYKSIIILVIALFVSLFFGMTRTGSEEQTLLMYISRNILVAFIFITLIYISRLYKEWLLIRRTPKTISNIKRLITLGLINIAIFIAGYWLEDNLRIIAAFSIIFVLIAAIVMQWQISGRNDWIYNLSKKSKVRLFWLSGALSFLFFVFSILVINQESNFAFALKSFSRVSMGFTIYLIVLNFIFILRVWFTSMSSLPNAELVERKSSELSSLAYLNQFVTESVEKDIDHLLSTVTDLAVRSSRATGGWCEVYKNDKIEILTSVNFRDEEINIINEIDQLKSYIKNISEPKLIQTISEDRFLAELDRYLRRSKSMLIIPIKTNTERVGTIILTNVYEFGFDSNDLMMMSAFTANMRIALENAKLMKDSIEKEKYKNELLLAQRIQKKLLPQKLPNIQNYSIDAFNIPATEVGGDYYDVVFLKNNDPCIVIADVSGKGISAAFYMAQLKGVVLSVARTCESPKELLLKTNETLYGNMEKQMYITMSAVRLFREGNMIQFSRAGHMPLFIKSEKDVKTYVPKGLGIGLAKSDTFEKFLDCIDIDLKENNSFLLFTDGINELRLNDNEEFGYEPLINILKNNNDSAESIIDQIKNKILDLKGEISGHDDMTIVAVINKNGIPTT